jgi:DNA-binding beta-propeller fold protein YncE
MSPPYRPSGPNVGPDTDTNKRLFVSCFEAGEVYVVDPYLPQIISIIEVGRGPAGLAFSNESPPERAYVVGFGANNVSVIDLVEGSQTQFHVIERIGFPSPTPR